MSRLLTIASFSNFAAFTHFLAGIRKDASAEFSASRFPVDAVSFVASFPFLFLGDLYW